MLFQLYFYAKGLKDHFKQQMLFRYFLDEIIHLCKPGTGTWSLGQKPYFS